MLLILIHHQQRILTSLFISARHIEVIVSLDTDRILTLHYIADNPATAIAPCSFISIQSWSLQKFQNSLHLVYISLHNEGKPCK